MTVIREFNGVSDQVVVTPQDASYIVQADTGDTFDVKITLKEQVLGTFVADDVTLQFVDGGAGVDTLTRDKGSWIDDHFAVGMILTIADTSSNNSTTYEITVITETTLTFATATVTAETDVTGATITGNIPDADWIVYEQIGSGVDKFTYIEGCGTGLRFVRTAGTGTSNVWVQS